MSCTGWDSPCFTYATEQELQEAPVDTDRETLLADKTKDLRFVQKILWSASHWIHKLLPKAWESGLLYCFLLILLTRASNFLLWFCLRKKLCCFVQAEGACWEGRSRNEVEGLKQGICQLVMTLVSPLCCLLLTLCKPSEQKIIQTSSVVPLTYPIFRKMPFQITFGLSCMQYSEYTVW